LTSPVPPDAAGWPSAAPRQRVGIASDFILAAGGYGLQVARMGHDLDEQRAWTDATSPSEDQPGERPPRAVAQREGRQGWERDAPQSTVTHLRAPRVPE